MSDRNIEAAITWVSVALVVVGMLFIGVLLCGCASPVCKQSLPTQRTDDLDFPCTKCGQPATGQYEIGDGFEDRCDTHNPETAVPKKKPVTRIEWCERCGKQATKDWSEVRDEHNWRCDKCKPRDVMPKQRRRLQPTRNTLIVKG